MESPSWLSEAPTKVQPPTAVRVKRNEPRLINNISEGGLLTQLNPVAPRIPRTRRHSSSVSLASEVRKVKYRSGPPSLLARFLVKIMFSSRVNEIG